MIRSYLKVAFRNILSDKLYSAIKILSLLIGITCFLLISFFVQDELSYDRHHQHYKNIYRVGYDVSSVSAPSTKLAWVSALVAPKLVEDYPELSLVSRVRQTGGILRNGDIKFREVRGFWADKDFFKIFTHPMLAGDPETALEEPNSIVLTESYARKYFGDQDPIGQGMVFLTGDTLQLEVKGLIPDVPESSHFKFDFLISHSTREIIYPHINGWFALGTHTYMLIPEGVEAEQLESKIAGMVMHYYGEEAEKIGYNLQLFLQPLSDIHLRSDLGAEIETNSSITNVYIFSVIAVFVLVLAIINFINLSTARSLRYSKSIGVRKVIGSGKGRLVAQFLTESIVLTVLSVVVAMGLVEVIMSPFNTLVGKSLASPFLRGYEFWLILAGITILIGILGGSYPAFIFSSYKPADILRKRNEKVGNVNLRRVLVVFQFLISMILIAGTFIIYDQLNFMHNKPLGFAKEQVIVVDNWMNRAARQNPDVMKSELQNVTGVINVSGSNSVPGQWLLDRSTQPEGYENLVVMSSLIVDFEFARNLELQVVAGRLFDKDVATDAEEAFLLNEAAIDELGWTAEEAVGKQFAWGSNRSGQVIGVLRDFHYYSLQEEVKPLVMLVDENSYGYLTVKVEAANIGQTINELAAVYAELYPDYTFDYSFLDEDFEAQYQSEQRLGNLTTYFSMVGIAIASLGLIGLVSSATASRTKEIGIRKVHGSSIASIVYLLLKDFSVLIIISLVIATPVVWYTGDWWLSEFAYRTNLGAATFILSYGIILLIAWLTMSIQSIKAARVSPVKSLKEE